MKRPRITTSWMMVAVLLLAVALGFGLPAINVYRDPDLHLHEWAVLKDDGKLDYEMSGGGMVSPPFWPRYWRRLLGRPENTPVVCTGGAGHVVEACERNYPKQSGECYVDG